MSIRAQWILAALILITVIVGMFAAIDLLAAASHGWTVR